MMSLRKCLLLECTWTRLRSLHCSEKRVMSTDGRRADDVLKELLQNAVVGDSQKVGDRQWLSDPYASEKKRDQASKAIRPKIDPRQTSIILFPGQGVQKVGMGKALLKIPEVKSMFRDANQILEYDLLDLCLNGPQSKLNETMYCQPAIFVASLAALQLMIEERQLSVESCIATAGFSVGEYAALVLAGSLNFQEGLKLVKQRAELMQAASEAIRGGMTTLFLDHESRIGQSLKAALDCCTAQGVEKPVCSVANYLYPNCRVIGGNIEALEFIEKNFKNLRIRRCRRLPVSGAFHTDLMKPAADQFAEVIRKCHIKDPLIPVHSNVDGLPYRDAKDIKNKLIKQIFRPVRWEQTLHILYDRKQGTSFPQTFEVGPGKSLTSLLMYANRKAAEDAINVQA